MPAQQSSPTPIARTWFAATALTVLVGLALQLDFAAGATGGQFDSAWARVLNVFCYFTVLSNVLVAGTSALLALAPDRGSALLRTLRLDALVGIAVTGVVYHVALRGLRELQGQEAVADVLLHTVSPLLCVIGWLLFGPRGALDRATVLRSLAYPALWLLFTLVRGAVDDFYPYPFVDVATHGYLRVALNCLLVGAVFLALAWGAWWLDRRLDGRLPRR